MRVPSKVVSVGVRGGQEAGQSPEVWHCCELLLNFGLSFWTSCLLRSHLWVSVRLDDQEQNPLTAAFTPGP